jgi:hypothetical protein
MVPKTGHFRLTANIHLVIQCTTDPKALLLLDIAPGQSDNLETL